MLLMFMDKYTYIYKNKCTIIIEKPIKINIKCQKIAIQFFKLQWKLEINGILNLQKYKRKCSVLHVHIKQNLYDTIKLEHHSWRI